MFHMNEFPIIPGRGLVTKMATQLRHEFLKKNNLDVEKISEAGLDLDDIKNNIESYVGSTEVPVGIVGPLLYNDNKNNDLVYCLAGTLEGALVASMNRGAKAITNSGGFTADVVWQKMCRVPMFIFNETEEALLFRNFAIANFYNIKKVAEQYSNHAKLLEIDVIQLKNIVHIKFIYKTGDASGQNMTTSCTWHAMLYIVDQFKKETEIVPIDYIIEGNGSSDKKASLSNIENGRGINVTAECNLTEKIINQILRTTSEKLYQCFLPSQEICSSNGMLGYNVNVANAIAAIYVTTGQDLACIHESSIGFLHLEKTTEGLKLKLNLTNLVIGTVGGGTHLPKQAEALKLMDCLGSGKVERFAKLICGFALGLEISTYSAIVSGEFAKAHEKLGRNKPKNWLTRSELTPKLLLSLLTEKNQTKTHEIAVAEADLIENGILTNIASRINKKLIGFIPLNLREEKRNGKITTKKLLIKSKALDEEVIKGLHLIAASIDPKLSDLFKSSKENLEFINCHIKEIDIYNYLSAQEFKYIPKYYGCKIDSKREIYFFIQEFLDHNELKIANSENHPEKWKQKDICAVISVINSFHETTKADHLAIIEDFKPWKSVDLYKKLISLIINENEQHPNHYQLKKLYKDIDFFETEAAAIDLKKSIIHNDFNSRNIFLDNSGNPIIYDWELAVIDFKHRDIVEFLSFVLQDDFTANDLWFYLKFHHQMNENENWAEYIKAYSYTLKTYLACRVSFYEVSGILIKYDFSKRIMNNAFRMLEIVETHA
jgi:hydroxymethylglutaryl-CoA reductase (NADPH)